MALLLSGAAIALFLAAAVSDAARRTIPNGFVVGLSALGLVRIAAGLTAGGGIAVGLTAGGGIAAGLTAGGGIAAAGLDVAAALAVLGLGAAAFAGGVLGGGDAKLLAAGTLWLGTGGLAPYLIVTVLAGGALAILYVVRRLAGSRTSAAAGLPYAIAIATGGILATAGPLLA